jgi:hypothetical protein
MMNLAFTLALILSSSQATLTPEFPAAYTLDVKLDTASQSLSGRENVRLLNPTSDTLGEIAFHLYPNAFKDTSSTYAREDSRILSDIEAGNISNLELSDITIDGAALDFEQCSSEGTLYRITLSRKLPPGDSLSIALKFDLKLPKIRVRFGYDEYGNYLLSHWHPILCGYQKGRQVDFEYHSESEFFSNFASYDVKLDIPAGFAIGSTGEIDEISRDSSRVIWEAHADSVIDFAFACGPAFEVTEKDTLGIKLRYFLREEHSSLISRVDWMTKFSLAYNSGRFFKYPYPVFTLVDFDMGAQGMELPGMVAVTFPDKDDKRFGGVSLNLTIAHEVTHEWFYGVIASNEAEEPWLDEGFTSYWSSRLLESGGDSLSEFKILGYEISIDFIQQMLGRMTEAEWPVSSKSWEFPDNFNYSSTVYYRAELLLKTLEQYLGRAAFDSAMTRYANRYRFKHPDSEDFKREFSDACGVNLDNFFAQFVDGSARLDYGMRALKYAPAPDSAKGKYKIDLTVVRERDGIIPRKVIIAMENGAAIDTAWDGIRKIGDITVYSNERPISATLADYALDEQKANDSIYLNSFSSRIMSFEWDMISLMEFLLACIL